MKTTLSRSTGLPDRCRGPSLRFKPLKNEAALWEGVVTCLNLVCRGHVDQPPFILDELPQKENIVSNISDHDADTVDNACSSS